MAAPKTHLERARAAAERVIGKAASDEERDIIARETYPTELVAASTKAAEWMRRAILANVEIEGFDPDNHVALRPLLDALNPYQETP